VSFTQTLGWSLVNTGCRLLGTGGKYPVHKAIDPTHLEVLADRDFQASVKEVADLTILDTARLANLWSLVQLTDPKGSIIEVGCYKGGSALHLSNACKTRKIIVCDTFAGLENVRSDVDSLFKRGMFHDARAAEVAALFEERKRDFVVLMGTFPGSMGGNALGPISFAHVDCDVYASTLDSLNYIANWTLDRSLIVVDDYKREAVGVNKAVDSFLELHLAWRAFPLFPGQCLLVSH